MLVYLVVDVVHSCGELCQVYFRQVFMLGGCLY